MWFSLSRMQCIDVESIGNTISLIKTFFSCCLLSFLFSDCVDRKVGIVWTCNVLISFVEKLRLTWNSTYGFQSLKHKVFLNLFIIFYLCVSILLVFFKCCCETSPSYTRTRPVVDLCVCVWVCVWIAFAILLLHRFLSIRTFFSFHSHTFGFLLSHSLCCFHSRSLYNFSGIGRKVLRLL